MKLNKFLSGDKVKLLDGRTGIVQTKYSKNNNQYLVETIDDTGEKTFFTIFCNDMELISIQDKLTTKLMCRITESEKDAFSTKCKENGVTESESMRELIRKYLV